MSSSDVEFGIALIPIPNVSNNSIIDTQNEDLTVWKLKLCICLAIIFIILPMSFCDVYFGYNDNYCVSNSISNIKVILYYFFDCIKLVKYWNDFERYYWNFFC